MLKIAVVLLAIAAMGGLYMAARIFGGQKAPWALSILHALLGATALVLILLNVINGSGGILLAALVTLAVAALGGFFGACASEGVHSTGTDEQTMAASKRRPAIVVFMGTS